MELVRVKAAPGPGAADQDQEQAGQDDGSEQAGLEGVAEALGAVEMMPPVEWAT